MVDNAGYLTVEGVAADLGVSVHTARRYFRRGTDRIPGRKIGNEWRVPVAAYEVWRDGGPGRVILLDAVHVEQVPGVDPASFVLSLGGVLSGSDQRESAQVAMLADGMAALTANLMAMAPFAPGFSEVLMDRLEANQAHTHEVAG